MKNFFKDLVERRACIMLNDKTKSFCAIYNDEGTHMVTLTDAQKKEVFNLMKRFMLDNNKAV